jgi:hypothetical protein
VRLSFPPYNFGGDGPAPDKAQLFSFMPFVHDGVIHKGLAVPFYAGQMIKDYIKELMSLFKINGHADGAMQAILLFLPKYNQMRGLGGWDSLAEDVEYIGRVDELYMCDLQYKLDIHVQLHTTVGIMSTIMVGEKRKETTDTYVVEDTNELRQNISHQLQVPMGNILYQPVTVNIYYPKSGTWDEDFIAYFRASSAAEDKQECMQVICTWKDAAQSAINSLTGENVIGVWNWDDNQYLWNIKMCSSFLEYINALGM